MANNYGVDLRLDDNWQLPTQTNGDMLLVSDRECLLQDIRLEALTQAGDLFYDTDYGWSLLDFIQRPVDELLELELEQRIITKLSRRPYIDVKSIIIDSIWAKDTIQVNTCFALIDGSETFNLALSVGRVSIEVIEID